MKSPIEGPEGDWWSEKVNRRETIWLGLSGLWATTLFGWMLGWTEFGEQNQVGETVRVSTDAYQRRVQSYKESATQTQQGIVPPGTDVFVGAMRYNWDGLPAVLEAGTEYTFHLGSYDVQHGFSVRKADTLSKQLSLQVLPGYEWRVPMQFDETGTYHVVCNEFCGNGHRTMHGRFEVVSDLDSVAASGTSDGGSGTNSTAGDGGSSGPYGGWLSGGQGPAAPNWNGSVTDATGQDAVTVTVGPDGSFAFDPPAVRVSPGTTVTFEWASDAHNVAVQSQPDGANWSGHESIENTGFTFEHTFEATGTYRYYCTPHRSVGMKGVVEVV